MDYSKVPDTEEVFLAPNSVISSKRKYKNSNENSKHEEHPDVIVLQSVNNVSNFDSVYGIGNSEHKELDIGFDENLPIIRRVKAESSNVSIDNNELKDEFIDNLEFHKSSPQRASDDDQYQRK